MIRSHSLHQPHHPPNPPLLDGPPLEPLGRCGTTSSIPAIIHLVMDSLSIVMDRSLHLFAKRDFPSNLNGKVRRFQYSPHTLLVE